MNKPTPTQDRKRIHAALRELGEAEQDIEALTPSLLALQADPVPVSSDSTQRLVKKLIPLLPQPSKVHRAIAARWDSPWSQLIYFLDVARAQVRILRPDFWLYSAGLTFFGGLLTMSHFNLSASVILWLIAPILAVIGVHYGFQSVTYGVRELEAVCPVSPLRLALARLIIILSYDTLLLGALSGFFASISRDVSFSGLALNWLAPLMLVSGLSLTLSLRFSLRIALTISYAVWMAFVSVANSVVDHTSILTVESILLLIGAGCILVGILGQKKTMWQS